jgi:HprK-related kinase B
MFWRTLQRRAGNVSELGAIAAGLLEAHPVRHAVELQVGAWRCRISTNSEPLAESLRAYFRPWTPDAPGAPDLEVQAVQMPQPDLGLSFTDWMREPGKTGRKEEFADIPGGRVVRKVRTGMQFLLGPGIKLAFGPCERNDNQVINFVNTQLINFKLARGWALCHASAVVYRDRGLMFAGLSGGGKSTLALHLMSRGARFTSNDRLLVKAEDGVARMAGVPKLPRINPGTILNNPDLVATIPAARRAELERLEKDELWALEEKYDADITACFGPDRFAGAARADMLFVLNWDRNATTPTEVVPADLTQRRDLLGAVMKSPGPFYETADGRHPARKPDVDPELYLPHVPHIRALEIRGRADFEQATQLIETRLEGP